MAAPEAWHAGRTMRVLELLAFAPLSAPQLAAALHAQPRTVRRVLGRLVEDGYVTYSDNSRRVYEPTMRLVAMAGQVVENSSLARRARPYVALLHERAGETAHLVVPSYQSVLCLVHAASGDDGRPRLRELVPAHCTAGGKALLAWRDRWRESVLSAPLERFTERTVVDPAALRRTLERVRADGHATEDAEYQPDARAVAAPVVVAGEVIAALTLSGARLDLDAALAPVLQMAGELSDALRGDVAP
jgi:DNA-binding IclR family transcriptional regulator